VEAHWAEIKVILAHHPEFQGQLDHPEIENVWADAINPHEVFYQFHIKTGHFPNHHHFTLVA
jgi:hypothetical protein